MQRYTLGFIFTSSLEEVLLIHKLKPEWQKGRINGIGGKVEVGERALACIVREVKEEAALQSQEHEWIHMGKLSAADWITDVFVMKYMGDKNDAKSVEAEKIEWFALNNLPENIIGNLSWLIPLAIDKIISKTPGDFIANY